MIHRCDCLRLTMLLSTFSDSLTDLGTQSNPICGQHLSCANPRGPSLLTPRHIHVTDRSGIVVLRCLSIIWYLTCHFTFDCRPVSQIAMQPRDRQPESQIGISLCSQRAWSLRVNRTGKFFPGMSTVVTVRIMRILSVVVCSDVLIIHMILCCLHANWMRNKSESHSTNYPTLHAGCN